jgi:hypothetical protein
MREVVSLLQQMLCRAWYLTPFTKDWHLLAFIGEHAHFSRAELDEMCPPRLGDTVGQLISRGTQCGCVPARDSSLDPAQNSTALHPFWSLPYVR